MDTFELYKCLTDLQRVRLLNLLTEGPLCVCHLQTLLRAPQVKISKQLAYLKALKIVHAERRGTWMIYHLSNPSPDLLMMNLKSLREGSDANARTLQKDSAARKKLLSDLSTPKSKCPEKLFTALCC